MFLLNMFLSSPVHYLRIVAEIAILFTFIYSGLYYLRGTRGSYILAGLLTMLILLTFVADTLQLDVISWMLQSLWAVLAGVLIVIFQPELRRAFAQLGSRSFVRRMKKRETINEVVTAAINLANQRVGALIVFEREIGMRTIINNAVVIDAALNHYLIETIFQPRTPLHDGGVIIRNNQIAAAHCIFPLTHDVELQKTMGTRHRAAIGITEETDAIAVVVSEETGAISLACRGKLKKNVGPDKIARYLNSLLRMEEGDSLKGIFDSSAETNSKMEGFSKTPLKNG
ncbi:MAG: TIGR00159 family protein [Kiritimatiellaeota bacterium]|nr:TIGR00159 family protein [Kiritimatiellota bacterium]